MAQKLTPACVPGQDGTGEETKEYNKKEKDDNKLDYNKTKKSGARDKTKPEPITETETNQNQ